MQKKKKNYLLAGTLTDEEWMARGGKVKKS